MKRPNGASTSGAWTCWSTLSWPRKHWRTAWQAHLSVLAVAPQMELPPSLLKWLETWAVHRRVGDAALALFNGGLGDKLSATATPALLTFTGRHGLSFICGEINPADNSAAEPSSPARSPR